MSYNPFYNIENPELMGYEYAWMNFVKSGKTPENIIPDEILNSWKRCKAYPIDALVRKYPDNFCNPTEMRNRLSKNQDLMAVASPIMRNIIEAFNEKGIRIWIVDQGSIVLMDMSSKEDNSKYYEANVGRSCREEYLGTNSLDLAMRSQKPSGIIGAQHYLQLFHKFASYAAPIFSTSREIIGAIGIIVKTEQMSSNLLAMVAIAAKVIEDELQLMLSSAIIQRQNNEKQEIMDSVTDGIIYVDDNRIITHANRQISKFTGMKRDNLIGKNISIIQTIPGILSLSSLGIDQKNVQVKLRGRDKSYNCFLNRKTVIGGEGKIIWIFTPTEEIQLLADKIDSGSRAVFNFENITGTSKALINCIELARKVAEHQTRAIIEGESGTGKEMFAQSIHNSSIRKNQPFVAVDCGAIPRELIESEIFGYEEGAYTGARKGGHRGKFEMAQGGTLFLDEIGNLPLDMQAKLLRVLQQNNIVRIGGHTHIPVDVQVIAATNLNLETEVEKGTFREDLFYRLNIIYIKLPPLRERKEDIGAIINDFIKLNRIHINANIRGIEDEALNILKNYHWPGNVRQLNNTIERMMIMAEGELLKVEMIPDDIARGAMNLRYLGHEIGESETLEEICERYVKYIVEESRGNIKKAAEKLGISRATVYRFMRDANV